ncbi:MAG: hypothetical protein ACK4S8_08600 [Alishewanella aestuarii]
MKNFRDTRIGVVGAAGLIGVSVRELKESVQQNKQLKGSDLPAPIIRAGGHYQWIAGDLMDFLEYIQNNKSDKEIK